MFQLRKLNKMSGKSITIVISSMLLASCSSYTPESKSNYDMIMMNGEIISSSTNDHRLTKSIVKYQGKLHTCYEGGAGNKWCE